MTFDKPRLPDLEGKNVVHLQCHIGTDTLSLARLGAASVTGLDFSDTAIKEGQRLSDATSGSGGEKLKWAEASVYDAPKVLGEGTFDVVFTGIGAVCWIHSIQMWAEVVSKLLKPGGKLFIREGHPLMWCLDDRAPEGIVIRYPYFELPNPTSFDEQGTYVETDHVFVNTATCEFNHGIAEIIQALIDHGMRITAFEEHQSVPWEALPGQMVNDGNGKICLFVY